ncbi:MAG TPA: FAD-dependent oxidoreductase, partial [Anseongella sp.]
QNELGVSWSFAEDQGYNTPYNRMMMKKRGVVQEMLPYAQYLPQMPYVRESRRIVGVKTLVADDLERGENARHFQTSVAMGDYYMDLHHTYEALEFDLDRSDFTQDNGPFQIPFEVFIPAELDGFLPAEKNFSQSRLVSGATRLQPVTMLTGQAVGTMASLAVSQGVQPRDLDPLRVQLELLDEGSTLIQRWYADVPWNSELWKAVQVLCLYRIMDRPGPITSKNGMGFSATENWGTDRPISEKEAVDGIRKLALVLGYTLNDPTQDAFRGSSLTGARFYELAGQISADLTRLVQIPWAGEAITQKDFALFSLKCIRKVYR